MNNQLNQAVIERWNEIIQDHNHFVEFTFDCKGKEYISKWENAQWSYPVEISHINTRHSDPDDAKNSLTMAERDLQMIETANRKGFDRCDKMWRDRINQFISELKDEITLPDQIMYKTIMAEIICLESLLSDTESKSPDNGWIPVSEGLPEKGKCVQIWREGLSIIPTNAYLYEYWINNTGHILDDVTHWRLLPEPPKSVKP